MKYVGKRSLSFFVEILLIIVMIATIVFMILLPKITLIYVRPYNYSLNDADRILMLWLLYPLSLCGLIVENELRKIFKSLVDANPFVAKNVRSLKIMGICMVIVFVVFCIGCFFLRSWVDFVVCIGSGILAIFCFVLADVFNQAIKYKQDTDLTI